MLVGNHALSNEVVNVASVPHRSVFRYPGGKTWFVPTLRRWLGSFDNKPKVFVEPFAGGGILGLTAAFENLANKVVLCELDEDVSAVWKTLLGADNAKLAKLILNFTLSRETAESLFSKSPRSTLQRAFQTVVRNRVSHAGIMAPGAGLTKNGESGRGLASRWYPETLAKRIFEIQQVTHKIEFIQGSAFDVIPSHVGRSSSSIFVDPPYTAGGKRAGSRLYKYCDLNHDELFDFFVAARSPFLFTYDDSDELRKMARERRFEAALIAMKNSHHAKMTELLIGKDLSWLQNT